MVSCKLGANGCWNDGKCRVTFNCENKVVTNADRIRSMTDEELAEFLCGVYDEDEDYAKFINGYYIPCYEQHRIKEWLQQPAEE